MIIICCHRLWLQGAIKREAQMKRELVSLQISAYVVFIFFAVEEFADDLWVRQERVVSSTGVPLEQGGGGENLLNFCPSQIVFLICSSHMLRPRMSYSKDFLDHFNKQCPSIKCWKILLNVFAAFRHWPVKWTFFSEGLIFIHLISTL